MQLGDVVTVELQELRTRLLEKVARKKELGAGATIQLIRVDLEGQAAGLSLAVSLIDDMLAQPAPEPLDAVADWLVACGYPFDYSTDPLPPEALRTAVEEAWVRKDGPDYADDIRACVADEGRWIAALPAQEAQPVTDLAGDLIRSLEERCGASRKDTTT